MKLSLRAAAVFPACLWLVCAGRAWPQDGATAAPATPPAAQVTAPQPIPVVALPKASKPPGKVRAWRLAQKARSAEKKGDAVKAYLLYAQAAAAKPSRNDYWARAQALRTRALRVSKTMPASLLAQAPPAPAAKSEPQPPPVDDHIAPEEEREARQPQAPAELRGTPGVKNLDLRGDARSLFEQVARAYGLDTVFDADYQGGQPIRFRMEQVDYRTALRALQAATSSFVVPLSAKLMMVYKDTQQKRAEGEPMVAIVVPLPAPVTLQEAQELARAVQQVMEINRFAVDGNRRVVLLKDRSSKVRAAQAMFNQLMGHRAQVLVEVELLDVQSRSEMSFGVNLPNSTAAILLGRPGVQRRGLRILADIVPGFTRFIAFGGGMSTAALAIADASLHASFTRSHSSLLYRSLLRSVDGLPATLHLGDKYPIISQQFMGAATLGSFGMAPTFNFEDLGLTLKITARVHDGEEISLQVEAEFKVLGSGSYNGIPVIANRKFASTVRMRNGEWGILAGILSGTEARSVSGLPGLAQVPILSKVLAQNTRAKDEGQALIVIKPHIIDAPVAEPAQAIYVGSEGRLNTIP